MWQSKAGKEEDLLKELCGEDGKLRDVLSGNLCENPMTGISTNDLGILIEEAEKSGDYRSALDKAIFEAAQKPGERQKYVKVVQDLASKSLHATEKDRERAEREGLTGRALSLGTRIEAQKFMIERAEDIVNVASKFYIEKLLAVGEEAGKEARARERRATEVEGRRVEILEQTVREARQQETRKMGGEAKKEAERRGKTEELAAAGRKQVREDERVKAEGEEKRIGDLEQAGRQARERERKGN